MEVFFSLCDFRVPFTNNFYEYTTVRIGKILNDATALSEYKIQENSFVVVMVSKPKPKPAEVGV